MLRAFAGKHRDLVVEVVVVLEAQTARMASPSVAQQHLTETAHSALTSL